MNIIWDHSKLRFFFFLDVTTAFEKFHNSIRMERRTIGSLEQEHQTINSQGQRTLDQQGRWQTVNWKGQWTVNQSKFQFQIIRPITNYHVPLGLLHRCLQRQTQSVSI